MPLSRDSTLLLSGLPAVAAVTLTFFLALSGSPEGPGRSRLEPGEVSHVRACKDLMERAQGDGLVVSRPASDRIIVDERRWSDLPSISRRILASAVRCTAKPHGQAYGTVYGLRSGRRLALVHDAGVQLD
jgi:hypothetical protein